MRKPNVVPAELRASIVAALRKGHSRVRAAADAGVQVHAVDKIAQEDGIERTDSWRKLSPERRAQAERLMRMGVVDKDIKKRLRMCKDTVKRIRLEMADG